MAALSPDPDGSVVELVNASREHRSGPVRVAALDSVSLIVSAGEAVAVVGRSGAGKTTLLNLIGGLDRPTSGRVTALGHDLGRLSERELTRFRASSVGLVFQDSYLLPGPARAKSKASGDSPSHERAGGIAIAVPVVVAATLGACLLSAAGGAIAPGMMALTSSARRLLAA